MEYQKSKKYNSKIYTEKIMGPNPIKLTEELMLANQTESGATVMDLGSGQGVTSVFLAKEYGFHVYAADLWSDPDENRSFFESLSLTDEQITPVKADATDLPFDKELFDAVVSSDSYNYFGRDPLYLDDKLLPFVKKGGYIYLAVTGMKQDFHGSYPAELLLSWNEEQLEYIRDIGYWRSIVEQSHDCEIISITEMQSNEEIWADWIKEENEYAVNDRKSVEAGALKYMNFISIVLRKK